MPNRLKHGLDSYGEEAGIPKPKIEDWYNLTKEEYAHRCVEDVKINRYVFNKLMGKLEALYEGESTKRIVNYLMFKMKCLRLQQESRWKLDKELVNKELPKLEKEYEDKVTKLEQSMPDVPKYAVRTRPAKPYKKDGTLSVTGAKWFNLLKEHNLPEDYDGEIQVVVKYEPPNPGSTPQIKDWLFSMGWEPQSFKFTVNAHGEEKSIPQVRIDGDEGKELCPSVLKLADNNPIIKELEGMTILSHRIAILKGFLENASEDGYLIAEAAGLTNTLRFKHRVIVNLPGVDKPYGEIIRGSLIARLGQSGR
jgi:hypothetical protein